jgi:hypothetical protein
MALYTGFRIEEENAFESEFFTYIYKCSIFLSNLFQKRSFKKNPGHLGVGG